MTKIVVIGFDPSSKKLAAVITKNGKSVRVWTRTLPDPAPLEVKADWAERHTRRLVREYVRDGWEVYFFLEEPVVGRGGANATITQATVRGGILIGARRGGAHEVHGVNNQRWKKVVCGNGGISKPDVARHILRTWPKVYDIANGDQDVCDAACINAYGEEVLKLEQRIKQHREKEEASA